MNSEQHFKPQPVPYASIHHNRNIRAASGSDSSRSGIGPGRGKLGEGRVSQELKPSDGSASKCLEKDYGKPLKLPRRSFLNFCKRLVRVKEKPGNCPPCPPSEPEESFWDYLFKFDDKPIPEPSTCRVAQGNREACRKSDPRLSDPRYRRTEGDVLIFTEPLRASYCHTSKEPQPRPPPGYVLPKAVAARRLEEVASSPYPIFAKTEDENEVQPRCSVPRQFRIPFEECRPPRRPRESFSCEYGTRSSGVAPPMSTDRGTCGGKTVGEFLAEETILRIKPSEKLKRALGTRSEPIVTVRNFSRHQELQQLTKIANCGKEFSKTTFKPSLHDKLTRKMSTED